MTSKIQGIPKLSTEIDGLFNVINEESDIVCVLIATSYLDQTLASMLENFFIKGNTSSQLLSPVNGALGTFSARTDIAYCLGLIPKGLYQNLRTVGEIRNAFAHHYLTLDFSDQHIADLTNRLSFPAIDHSIHIDENGTVTHNQNPWGNFNSTRTRFTVIVVQMIMALLMKGHQITRRERPTKQW